MIFKIQNTIIHRTTYSLWIIILLFVSISLCSIKCLEHSTKFYLTPEDITDVVSLMVGPLKVVIVVHSCIRWCNLTSHPSVVSGYEDGHKQEFLYWAYNIQSLFTCKSGLQTKKFPPAVIQQSAVPNNHKKKKWIIYKISQW